MFGKKQNNLGATLVGLVLMCLFQPSRLVNSFNAIDFLTV